ncbi:uncharacterized protein L969DRAFT_86185 [Mixia osmundae IAM 14324]|nr:uncharacterized protein L969DRAFT_86185 [Mixia osmundae IAM 14324]KEI40932.1 hypothetical protein L969DRAFT_86185 [Mixia osmundae IAM 14324]
MRRSQVATALFLIAGWLANDASASIGDRSMAYQACRNACIDQTCSGNPSNSQSLSWTLRAFWWTCGDQCAYVCMHHLTDLALSVGQDSAVPPALVDLRPGRMSQFYGKWPFYRLGGIQEPLSVVFSIANGVAHAAYLPPMRRLRANRGFPAPLAPLYAALPMAGINTWVFSAIFHTRDWPSTEKLDYFSAAAGVMFSLFVASVRLSGIYTVSTADRMRRRFLGTVMTIILLAHTSYLTFWHFDYSYNMKFGICLGLSHNALWVIWALSFRSYKQPKARAREIQQMRKVAWQGVGVLTALTACTALELLDFQPIGRLLDAHALWHLSTIPIVCLWYQFLLDDAMLLSAQHGDTRRQSALPESIPPTSSRWIRPAKRS